MYIGTYQDGIWETSDGGQSWIFKTAQASEITDVRSLVMHPGDSSIIFAGTRSNGIWKSPDAGASWEKISTVFRLAQTLGDIDHSGIVDLGDAILALKILAGIVTGQTYTDADIDGDGKIGLAEVLYILQHISR